EILRREPAKRERSSKTRATVRGSRIQQRPGIVRYLHRSGRREVQRCLTACAAPGRAERIRSSITAVLMDGDLNVAPRPCGAPYTARTCARSSTDRASDYGSEGWGFESLRARHTSRRP